MFLTVVKFQKNRTNCFVNVIYTSKPTCSGHAFYIVFFLIMTDKILIVVDKI